MLGMHLSDKLAKAGFDVVHLSRQKPDTVPYPTFVWNLETGEIEKGAFDKVEYIIHLAGAGIADKRWTKSRKKVLGTSRIGSANVMYSHLKSNEKSLKAFISASAIGIYGYDTGNTVQKESQEAAGSDFLSWLTHYWEAAADQFDEMSERTVKFRIGLILSEKGGVLKKMMPMVKLGLGSALGTGNQYMSWIHIDDVANMMLKAIQDKNMNGVYNAVAPQPITNSHFVKRLSKVMLRPYFLPNTPKFVLNMVFGELAEAIVGGNNVSSEKIEKAGFAFRFANITNALKDLVNK